MPVSERLSTYIKTTKKSVTQLARDMDMPQTTLNNIVTGRTKPSYKVLIPLANAGLDVHWLLTGQGSMMREDYEGKIINQGNATNQFGGNNNTGISNELNTSSKNVAYLEKRIETLESQLADKDKIIRLLEGR